MMPQITQADRDAAAAFFALIAPTYPHLADAVANHDSALGRAFAAHREAEREKIAAWLRQAGAKSFPNESRLVAAQCLLIYSGLATAIEKGQHHD